MKCKMRQWLAGFLAVVMVFSMLPVTAMAENDDPSEKTKTEQVQELIGALPEAVTAENRTDVERQIAAIDTAMRELTEEEMAGVDTARYAETAAALQTLDEPVGGELRQISIQTAIRIPV